MTAHLVTLYRRHPSVAPALFYGGLGACAVVGAGLAVAGCVVVGHVYRTRRAAV